MLRLCLIPIMNTTFIELSTTAYLRNTLFSRLIVILNLVTLLQEHSNQVTSCSPLRYRRRLSLPVEQQLLTVHSWRLELIKLHHPVQLQGADQKNLTDRSAPRRIEPA
jgi:hypothetical protein